MKTDISKTVSFEQAVALRNLGFRRYVLHYYDKNGRLNNCSFYDNEYKVTAEDIEEDCNASISNYSAPTVSEALDFIREEKGIECTVMLEYEADFLQCFYYGEYVKRKTNIHAVVEDTATFDTHPLASSALLDAVLTYLEEKK